MTNDDFIKWFQDQGLSLKVARALLQVKPSMLADMTSRYKRETHKWAFVALAINNNDQSSAGAHLYLPEVPVPRTPEFAIISKFFGNWIDKDDEPTSKYDAWMKNCFKNIENRILLERPVGKTGQVTNDDFIKWFQDHGIPKKNAKSLLRLNTEAHQAMTLEYEPPEALIALMMNDNDEEATRAYLKEGNMKKEDWLEVVENAIVIQKQDGTWKESKKVPFQYQEPRSKPGWCKQAKIIVGGHFRLGRKMYQAHRKDTYEGAKFRGAITLADVAITLEPRKEKRPCLAFETRMLQACKGTGFQAVKWMGEEGDYFVSVREPVEETNLKEHLAHAQVFGRRGFSLKTVCLIAIQMINRLELMHQNNWVHRNLLPEDIHPGHTNKRNTLFITDFGKAKRFRIAKDGEEPEHIPYRDHVNLTWRQNPSFTSLKQDLMCESSRRDDMESLGYILLYFLKGGKLPWHNKSVKGGRTRDDSPVHKIKALYDLQVLCSGFPEELKTYIEYCRKLGFTEEPDYDHLRQLFADILNRFFVDEPHYFDWWQSEVDSSQIEPFLVREHALLMTKSNSRQSSCVEPPSPTSLPPPSLLWGH